MNHILTQARPSEQPCSYALAIARWFPRGGGRTYQHWRRWWGGGIVPTQSWETSCPFLVENFGQVLRSHTHARARACGCASEKNSSFLEKKKKKDKETHWNVVPHFQPGERNWTDTTVSWIAREFVSSQRICASASQKQGTVPYRLVWKTRSCIRRTPSFQWLNCMISTYSCVRHTRSSTFTIIVKSQVQLFYYFWNVKSQVQLFYYFWKPSIWFKITQIW